MCFSRFLEFSADSTEDYYGIIDNYATVRFYVTKAFEDLSLYGSMVVLFDKVDF